MNAAEIDAAQCRNDAERKLVPLPAWVHQPAAAVECAIRARQRETVAIAKAAPWRLFGHGWQYEVHRARREHSASIRREHA